MRQGSAIGLLFLICSVAFGQFTANSITVSASNNSTLQPDQAIFSVSVQTSLTTGLDDVLAALQGSGITAANLTSVSTQGQFTSSNLPGASTPPPSLYWTFNFPASLANTKATVASFTTLAQGLATQNSGISLSFSIVGTQVSQQLAQAQTCSLAGLIASATTQAQSLAAAGSVALGPIIALSGSTSNVASNPYAAAPPCAITVTFGVTRH